MAGAVACVASEADGVTAADGTPRRVGLVMAMALVSGVGVVTRLKLDSGAQPQPHASPPSASPICPVSTRILGWKHRRPRASVSTATPSSILSFTYSRYWHLQTRGQVSRTW